MMNKQEGLRMFADGGGMKLRLHMLQQLVACSRFSVGR